MNKPQIIYDFLCRLEPFTQNNAPHPYNSMKAALNVDDSSYDRCKHKLAHNIFEVVDFIEADHSQDNDYKWEEKLLKLLISTPHDQDTFLSLAKSLFPYTKIFIQSQIRIWDLVNSRVKNISEENISKLKQDTKLVVKNVIENNEWDDDIRVFVIKKLREITHALDHYHIYGNEGLVEILEQILGHKFTNKNYNDYMQSEKSNPWKTYLMDLSVIIATTENVISIGSSLQNPL